MRGREKHRDGLLGTDAPLGSADPGWFVATFLFETFVLNRNLSLEQILQTYNVAAGEYWGLVLLWIGLLPSVLYRLKAGQRLQVRTPMSG